MKRLALAMLWFYSIGLGLAAVMAFPTAGKLALALAVSSAMCLWAAREQSRRAVATLGAMPLVIGLGALASQGQNQPPDLRAPIAAATLLWGGLCLAIVWRMGADSSAAP